LSDEFHENLLDCSGVAHDLHAALLHDIGGSFLRLLHFGKDFLRLLAGDLSLLR
jgi:hypothetical protein